MIRLRIPVETISESGNIRSLIPVAFDHRIRIIRSVKQNSGALSIRRMLSVKFFALSEGVFIMCAKRGLRSLKKYIVIGPVGMWARSQ